MTEFYDINSFVNALELEIIQSKLHLMRCVLCNIPTLERAVGILPGKPARPFLFAACDVCQIQPEWEEEVQRILSEYIANGGLDNGTDPGGV